MSGVRVRPAGNLDSVIIKELAEQAGLPFHEKGRALLAENGRPVGCVFYSVTSSFIHAYGLSVLPELQGNGIERQLLKGLEDEAQSQGLRFLSVTAEHGQERLYVKNGFDYSPYFGQDKGRDVLIKEL